MTSGNDGLYPIGNTTQQDRIADIVFVHGIGGSSHDTWRHGVEGSPNHFFWPEELGKDLSTCGIWTVGYPAGFTRLGNPGMIIEKRAGNLAQKLANAELGTRPLIFICHSMGGLVVKSLVTESQTNADEDRRRITAMVRGIIFCATPHRGSAFADAAGVLGQMYLGTQAHLDEMRANAEPLDLLHERFIEWQRRTQVPIESYAENIGLFRTRMIGRPLPLGLVVPRASANTGIAGHTLRDIDADHLSLVKPAHRQHDVYAGTLRFIRKIVQTDPAPVNVEKLVNIEKNAAPDSLPLCLYFAKKASYPSIAFSIANEGNVPIQITSIRSVVAAKAVDNHSGIDHILGTRVGLEVDINRVKEGSDVELLGERVISLQPGEIEAFSLTMELENTVALLDLDIDYVEVGARRSQIYSPAQVVLVHAPVGNVAVGSITILDRARGLDILNAPDDFQPWEAEPYRDCRGWRYAFIRGAGCFLIGDVNNRWPLLVPLLDDKDAGGPICASVAEVALRHPMPSRILEILRNRISTPHLAKRLGGSDHEAYAVSVARALKQLVS